MFATVLTRADGLTIESALLCTAASLILGLLVSLTYMFKATYTKSFAVTLVLLPVLVQVVMMMVNGNLGTGLAVAGAFSLIRFRSVPGSAKEICSIFFAMSIGLATGMGYLTFAFVVALMIGIIMLLLNITKFGEKIENEKMLRILIPEALDYTDVFTDLFEAYTSKNALEYVKTTNMGSMYELRYRIEMRDIKKEKEFLDAIRCRNGNLTVVCGRIPSAKEEL